MRFAAPNGATEKSAGGSSGRKITVNNALPAALVGLTALVTSGLVHAGYAVWWLSQALIHGHAAFDWAGALTVSGSATAVVLIAGLVVRRLVGDHAPTETDTAPVTVRARSEAVR
jgi:hypothetical protein